MPTITTRGVDSDKIPSWERKKIAVTSEGALAGFGGLLSLDRAAKEVHLAEEKLEELCDAGYVPHVRIGGGPPLFKKGPLQQWVTLNLMEINDGIDLPRELKVFRLPELVPNAVGDVPREIADLPGLCAVPTFSLASGIYFLLRENRVVYVGQSVAVFGRVGQHLRARHKAFDRALWLPLPEAWLNDVETALIATLEPELNANGGPQGRISKESSQSILARLRDELLGQPDRAEGDKVKAAMEGASK